MRTAVLLIIMFAAVAAGGSGCSRTEFEKGAVAPMSDQLQKKGDATVLPEISIPDVKIDPSAEIPSIEGATNVRVPDVQIDAMQGLDDIDKTRVDGGDDYVDEP